MNNILKDKFFDRVVEDFKVMTAVVTKQVKLVKQLLEDNKNEALYLEIYNNERILDSLDLKLRREVINAIVLYNPRATDLRQMMSNYDMTGYIERVGDLVMNIAYSLKEMDIKNEICQRYYPDIIKLLSTSTKMIEQSIQSFNDENNVLARNIIESDDIVDNLYHSISLRTRTDYGGQTLSQEQLNDLFGINGIAYNVERIADNATNIAEAAIYFAEGKDVKHAKMIKEEQDAEEAEKKMRAGK